MKVKDEKVQLGVPTTKSQLEEQFQQVLSHEIKLVWPLYIIIRVCLKPF